MKKLNKRLLEQVKAAFVPADPSAMAGGAPMDPSMAGGAPMDPSMAGGGMPVDPSMAGGGMPMDPSMAGGAPMDPSAMNTVTMSEKGFIDVLKTVQGLPTSDEPSASTEGEASAEKPKKATNQSILDAVNGLSAAIGVGAPTEPPPGPPIKEGSSVLHRVLTLLR